MYFGSLKNITNQKIYFHDNHSYQTRLRGWPGQGAGSWIIRVDSGQIGKIGKNIFEVLIFCKKKIKKQSMSIYTICVVNN